MNDLDGYERIGDFGRPHKPEKKQKRKQAEAEAMRAARCEVPRLSWKEYSEGVPCPGCGMPYRDDEHWDAKGTMHLSDDERARYDHEQDRYSALHGECRAHRHSVSGSLTTHCGSCCPSPPMSPGQIESLSNILARKTPDRELMRWRLRLYCGHVIEKRSHYTHKTVHNAFMAGGPCPECGQDPSTIVDAEPIGRVAEPLRTAGRPAGSLPKKLTRTQLEARVSELEKQLRARED